MTEQERHQKIALALKGTLSEVEALIETGRELIAESESLMKRSRQLMTLAEEFEAGKYLTHDKVSDDPDAGDPSGSS